MDKLQAQILIKKTFENPFDKERFIGFIKNLLNRIEDAPFTYQGQYIPDAFRQYISSLERIGKYEADGSKIDILIIKLQKNTSLERARTMQRNFVAWYLNGSQGGELKDAAIVAYISPDDADWRFSLVKMDYRFEESKTGRMKVKEEFTPARRWSFLVGANERSHTAQSRLVDMLANDEKKFNLAEIEDAFNIEKVTKEFFEKYRDLFIRTKEALDKMVKTDSKIKSDFEKKGVNTVDFAKKLLGQIIFLYFLQKKGWFGVNRDDDWGTGSKRFLRELFEKKHGNYKNFFNDILEPLFYEALRIDRSHDDDYYRYFDCKIPFLNGGLFDPIENYDWEHTDIHFSDSLFSNLVKTKEGDIGDGILDVFDRYNFTVKEDEPLEKVVAIDPELLGKAYEKFNAIRPDNFEEYKKALESGNKGEESKFNKQYGVYYTPREIVHHMCQQSLINYLFTELNGLILKEDIETFIQFGEQFSENDVRVANKGKETKTYSYQLSESIRKNAGLIDQKLANITVCDPAVGSGAFPVGMMTEIVKVRNILSTFINTTKQSAYDFKRECIEHSLYGVDIDPGAVEIARLRLWLSLVVDEDDIKTIKPLPNLDYKIVCGDSLLGVEKNLFNSHLFSQLEEIKPCLFNETNPIKKQDFKKKIDEIIEQITNGHKDFDFEVYFSEVFHRKKGFDVVIANPPYITYKGKQKVDIPDHYIKRLNQIYVNSAEYKINSFALFIEKGLSVLCKKGILSYIIPSTLLQNEYLRKIRKHLLSKYHINSIISFENKIFDAVTDSIILFASNTFSNESKTSFSRKDNLIFSPSDDKKYYSQVEWNKSEDGVINLKADTNEEVILRNIENNSKTLEVFLEANIGIKRAKAPIINSSQKGYKKFIVGRDLQRYHINFPNQFILFDLSLFHTGVDENIFKQAEKILVRKTGNILLAAYDDKQFYTDQSIYNLYSKKGNKLDLKYIIAVLNSRLLNFYFNKKMITNPDVFPYIKGIHLKKLPLKEVDTAQQKPFIDIVDKILKITDAADYEINHSIQSKVKEYEKQIDQMVYKLYGLTGEEIKIVEKP
jgi:tRNA1(Val) A37 N6-methylase TrmN6